MVEARLPHVAHDADDLARRIAVSQTDRDAPAERLFVRKVLSRQCFIDHDDVAHLAGFLLSEEATAFERDLQRAEKVLVGDADPRSSVVSERWFGPAFNIECGFRTRPGEGQKVDRARRLDAG